MLICFFFYYYSLRQLGRSLILLQGHLKTLRSLLIVVLSPLSSDFSLLHATMSVNRFVYQIFLGFIVFFYCFIAFLVFYLSGLQAAWALGNVAGDSPKFRDLVLRSDAMMPLLAQFNEHTQLSMLRNATWTLSNFCRGKPHPALEQVCYLFIYTQFFQVSSIICEPKFSKKKKRRK